jgi:hypothetical protein
MATNVILLWFLTCGTCQNKGFRGDGVKDEKTEDFWIEISFAARAINSAFSVVWYQSKDWPKQKLQY